MRHDRPQIAPFEFGTQALRQDAVEEASAAQRDDVRIALLRSGLGPHSQRIGKRDMKECGAVGDVVGFAAVGQRKQV